MSIVGLFIMLFCFIFHLIVLIGNLELNVVGTPIVATGYRHHSDLYQPPNKVAVSGDSHGCGLDFNCSHWVRNEVDRHFSLKTIIIDNLSCFGNWTMNRLKGLVA